MRDVGIAAIGTAPMIAVGRRAFGVGVASTLVAPETPRARAAVELAEQLTADSDDDRARTRRIFEFVRDEVDFGFTARFDHAPANATLRTRTGHCNPQARLFATMLRGVGVPVRYRFVQIGRDILHGLFPSGLPARLDHAYVEVELEGEWIAVDGYIVDPRLAKGAKARLRREGRSMGYGVHVDGSGDWDGRTSCMSQLVEPSMVVEDLGVFDEMDQHLSSSRYSQRLGIVGTVAMALMAPSVNRRLDRLRQGKRGC